MKNDLPLNAWLSPQGEFHRVDCGRHTEVARKLAGEHAPDETDALFQTLYALGWVRVQWEIAWRVNIAFHALTEPAGKRVEDLVDFLLHSDVEVYVVAPGDSDFLRPGDRKWKAKLRSLNAVPKHWGAGEGYGNPHA